jgi:hypothetical protein
VTPSEQITSYIASLTDWRGETVAKLRQLTLAADPNLAEEWKWNSPVWSREGLSCSASAFKTHVGVNFFQGAALEDPRSLFNDGLNAKASRSIKLRKGDTLDEAAFQDLVRAAVALNVQRR